jgi:2-polyprenyl-3-methyl-5-hydroxy-6-metoxy-1,4-benzoquinol methylase
MICKVCNYEINPNLVLENRNGINHIYRCDNCKVAFVKEQPKFSELNDYYNGMYEDLTVGFNQKKMDWALNSMKEYVKKIGLKFDTVDGKSFVDLGGGLGYYSKAASEYGFNSVLVEKDPVSVNFAKKELRLNNIVEQNLEEFFEQNKEKFDVVFFRHVIEHVTDPIGIVKGISSILKNNGILIIETDNNAGIEILFMKNVKDFYLNLYNKSFEVTSFFKLLKKRPFALDPPRHLFAFRMKNLSNLLLSHDIKPYNKVHYRLGHPIYWPNIPSPSIKKAIISLIGFKFKKGVKELINYFNLLFRRVLQLLGLSSGLCIYASKKDIE